MRVDWRFIVGAIGFSLIATQATQGGGIEVPMQGARAAGQADAFTAQADDASAIYYNPAGLTQLKGTHINAGAYFLNAEFTLSRDAGPDERMEKDTVLPHLYVASDFGTEKWRFGLGVNNVFGLNEDWDDDGSLRLLVNEAQLSLVNIAPTVAYQFNPQFSAGVALNIYYGRLNLTRNAIVAAPPVPEGQFDYDGEAFAFGVTPGMLWKINKRHSVGAYYRSPFSMEFEGDASVEVAGNPAAGPSKTKAELDFPQSIGVGYAFRPIERWKLELDVVWTDWDTVDELAFSSSNAAFDNQAMPADWDSGFTYRLGTEYQVNPNWTLRAGYAYSDTAVPDSTFSPIIPDSNYHLFSLGLGYGTSRWGIDLAGQYIHRESHEVAGSVNSPLVDGRWENEMFGLMATFSLKL